MDFKKSRVAAFMAARTESLTRRSSSVVQDVDNAPTT
jgi:hypothetical protein